MMKKLAFVDLTNFTSWPMGGMLEYERSILPFLANRYKLDLWGVGIDNELPNSIRILDKEYKVNCFAKCKSKHKLIPNFWKGLYLLKFRKHFLNNYDIVYVHTASCAVALSFIINPKYTKIVYHHHCFSYLNDNRLFALVQKPFYSIALRKSNASFIVADKSSVFQYTANCGFKHIGPFVAIGSPVNLENFDRKKILQRISNIEERHNMNFVYAGRIDSWKNVALMIKAFFLFHQKQPGSKLTIIGDGPEEIDTKNLIESLNINQSVFMLGKLPHQIVCKHLEHADAFLISSKGEGWSIAVLEAYASGLPVVCCNVQGLRSEVINGVTGYISEDYSELGFCNAMCKTSENLKDLSLNALEESEKYQASAISNQIIEVLDNL